MLRVIFETLGCRLNVAETGELIRVLKAVGYTILSKDAPEADFVIINTCTVTSHADSDSRNLIRKLHRRYPNAFIVVTGCYAQVSREEIEKIEGVDLVLGNSEKKNLLKHLEALKNLGKKKGAEARGPSYTREESSFKGEFWGGSSSLTYEKTRSFLKIQDGCNYFCSFCIIPYARNLKPSTMPVKEVLERIEKLETEGIKEVVLTGINLGTYESSTGESFADLLKEILAKTGVERIRLSSIEPNLFNSSLIDVLRSSKRIMPSFHIPLQSGTDKILSLMKRRYDTARFREVVESLKKKVPESFIGIDVMCGFPSESDEDFEKTFSFIKNLQVDSLHVFPYSMRKGTAAFSFKEQVDSKIKKERVKKLLDLSSGLKSRFMNSFLDREAEVLFEKADEDGLFGGHAENFLYVKVKTSSDLSNQIHKVKILKLLDQNAVLGELIL